MANVNDQAYGLKCEINNHKQSMSDATATVADIDEKLKRLNKAKKMVSGIQKEVNIIKLNIDRKIEQNDWKANSSMGASQYSCVSSSGGTDWSGEQRNKFDKRAVDFKNDYISFQNQLNDYFDNICNEITRLENEKYEQNGIIGWCQSKINSLGNELEKLFHTKEG